MKKFATLLTLLLLLCTLFAFVGCLNANDYAKERLINEGKYAIYCVAIPHDGWDATSGNYFDKKQIESYLLPFQKLTFSNAGYITESKFEDFIVGSYGLPYEEGRFKITNHFDELKKYVIGIEHSNGEISALLVDYDGTVYFANSSSKRVVKTQPFAVNPQEYRYVNN